MASGYGGGCKRTRNIRHQDGSAVHIRGPRNYSRVTREGHLCLCQGPSQKAITQIPAAVCPSHIGDRQSSAYTTWAILMDGRMRSGDW